MLRYTVSVGIVAAAAFLQTTNLLFIGQVKPNLIFALLAVFAHFEKDWIRRTVLILVPAIVLKFSPLISWLDLIFITSAFLIMALVDYLPWRRAINSIFTVIISTVIIGVQNLDIRALLTELGYNVTLVIILFVIINWIYGKTKAQTSRF